MERHAILSLPWQGCFTAVVPAGMDLQAGAVCVCECRGAEDLGRCRGLRETAPAGPADGALPLPEVRLLRLATREDRERERMNEELAGQALKAFAVECAGAPQAVRPVAARFTLDRRRLSLCYLAERPYDGRRNAHSLQRRFGAEVEMRQVGVRDESALLGGIGSCGRATCCATWMRHFHAVNVRMAKAQDLALNPAGINGGCGRLKCCLRYEYEGYRDAAAALPREGDLVALADGGEGCVRGRDILRGVLTLRTAEGRTLQAKATEVTVRREPAAAPPAGAEEEKEDADQSSQWTEPEAAGPA